MKKSPLHGWSVHKFGGSSLKNAKDFQRVLHLVPNHSVIVLSATYKTTEKLQTLLTLAAENQATENVLSALTDWHDE